MKHYKYKFNTNGYGHYFLTVGLVCIGAGIILRLFELKSLSTVLFNLGCIIITGIIILIFYELHQDKVLNKEAIEADAKLEKAIKRKSLELPGQDGQVWIEHLDDLYTYKDIVMKKFFQDYHQMQKTKCPQFVAVILKDTKADKGLLSTILQSYADNWNEVNMIYFIGLDKTSVRIMNTIIREEFFAWKCKIVCEKTLEKCNIF